MTAFDQGELYNSYGAESSRSTSSAAATSNPINSEQPSHEFFDDADGQFTTLFCRALYNYEAQDSSALSFRQGDIIEVLSQQPTGWWDGLLGEERGWFPSNYVTIISDEEAEAAFSGSEMSAADYSTSTINPDNSTVDMSHALMRGSQSENEDWLDSEVSYRNGARPTANGVSNGVPGSSKAQPGDYWMPEITADNQIWYVNERTGERARDIPLDSEDEVSDGDMAALTSQSSSRSTTSVNASFSMNGGSSTPHSSTHTQSTTEATPIPRSRTPDPWVKKVSKDGTYYYYNPIDGTAQWTRPHTRNGSFSASVEDQFPESLSQTPGARLSVYSDSSDVQPFDYLKPRRNGRDEQGPPPVDLGNGLLELTSAEKIAKTLQQSLEPPPVDRVTDLSTVATNAIHAVVDNVQAGLITRHPEEYARLDALVSHVVITVRSLLYVAAVPTGHISSSVLPKGVRNDKPNQSQHTATLKPMQRRVTATLSRLVLSARAMQYDSGSQVADTLNRIETDAEELERAIISFVVEIERVQQNAGLPPSQKRLEGVFSTTNLGQGLVGAGAAATWKGFGWVSLDSDTPPPRKGLSADVVADINSNLSALQDTIAGLGQALRVNNDSSVEQVRQKVQQSVAQISAFLSMVADVHIARHVDIDGIRQDELAGSDQYSESVETARKLVRTLETVVQGLYDDAAALLLTAQNLSGEAMHAPGERESSYDLLDKLSMSLSSNLSQCRQTVEAILSVGHEQADIAQGDYTGSIEWRMSRVSMISNRINGGPPPKQEPAYDSENEGLVDLEAAFSRPGGRKGSSAQDSMYPSSQATLANGSGLYQNGVHAPGAGESTTTFDGSTLPGDDQSVMEDDLSDDEPSRKPIVRSQKKGKDLGMWLGEEYAEKIAADSVAWYLRPNYSPSDIIIDTDGSVKGGTVPALVERLTAHEQLTDRTYTEAFLMTFKSFTTVDELVDLLIARYRIQPPDGLTPTEREDWGKSKQNHIQFRVFNTLKSIIQGDDIIEKEDMDVLGKIKAFVQSDDVSGKPAAKVILNLIERAERGVDTAKMVLTPSINPPMAIAPKVTKKLRLTDIDPLEIARQLTIMESQLYQRIKPMECLQRPREQKTDQASDNITLVIQTSNRIADWVADLVLSKEDSRKRANIIKHLINVADRCRTLNNFSSMIAITSGLNTPHIRRLKRTWDQVGPRHSQIFHACEATIDSNRNFNQYRQLMASVTPPCVPFIGVFLSTLQFIEDGNPDNLPGGLVNFRKRQKASEVISDIKRWQTQAFNLQPLPIVMNYIEESLNQFNDTKASSDHFWQLSLEREPREREDEKMARLLQESGFL